MLVMTTKGKTIHVDIVGVGLGLTMNIEIFRDAGIKTNVGIVTNEFLETNKADVWAAGDVAEFFDVVAQRHHRMGTWDNALNHGKHVAKNMLGAREPFIDVPVYASGMFRSNISVMGTTTEEEAELASVFHVDYDSRDYRRLFHKDSKIVGAILIGKMRGRKKVLELIASRTPVDTPHSVLEMLAAPEPPRPAAVAKPEAE